MRPRGNVDFLYSPQPPFNIFIYFLVFQSRQCLFLSFFVFVLFSFIELLVHHSSPIFLLTQTENEEEFQPNPSASKQLMNTICIISRFLSRTGFSPLNKTSTVHNLTIPSRLSSFFFFFLVLLRFFSLPSSVVSRSWNTCSEKQKKNCPCTSLPLRPRKRKYILICGN